MAPSPVRLSGVVTDKGVGIAVFPGRLLLRERGMPIPEVEHNGHITQLRSPTGGCEESFDRNRNARV